MLRIALCRQSWGTEWTDRMADALESERGSFAQPYEWVLIDMNRHDWLEKLKPFEVVVWPPAAMGIKATSHLREKIYFLQHHMGKLVLPNFETVWHFESKVAQSYIFDLYDIPTPKTVATFSMEEAMELLDTEKYPLVTKTSAGGASCGVRLAKNKRQAKWLAWKRLYAGFWWKVMRVLLGLSHREYVMYWQEFIDGNDFDLRITAVGDRCAFAFWRENRPRDFRASGSGKIVYDKPVPENIVKDCLAINRKLKFDSMGYDILFRGEDYVITEISYGYVTSAIYNTPGHYEQDDGGELTYCPGNLWPQQLWIRWLAQRVRNELNDKKAAGD